MNIQSAIDIPKRWVEEISTIVETEVEGVTDLRFDDVTPQHLDRGNEYIVLATLSFSEEMDHTRLPELTEKIRIELQNWGKKQDHSDFAIFIETAFHMNRSIHVILSACR